MVLKREQWKREGIKGGYWQMGMVASLLPFPFLLPGVVKFLIIAGLFCYFYFLFRPPSPKRRIWISRFLLLVGVALTLFYIITTSTKDYFTLYLSIILALLGIAMVAQLIEGIVPPIFTFSPFVAVLLVVIFHQSLLLLGWTIGIIGTFLFLILHSQTGGNWKIAIVEELKLLLLALPLIIILFLFFPRIGLQGAKLGLKGGEIGITGFSGVVKVTSRQVIKTNRPVLEVEFLSPPPADLYFRGGVSYRFINGSWFSGGVVEPPERVVFNSRPIVYKLKQFPTGERVLFGLDLPIESPPATKLGPTYVLKTNRPFYNSQLFLLNSVTNYRLIPTKVPRSARIYPNPRFNPKTYQIALQLRKIKNVDKRIIALNRFLASRHITYTLTPPSFSPNSLPDQLLFKYRKGYCLQIATAYALLARMANIPARLITGYKASPGSMVNNYLLVRGRDAHAWVEILSPDKGWVRIDPTNFTDTTDYLEKIAQQAEEEKGNLWLAYLRFNLEKWILYYNFFTQSKFIRRLKRDGRFRARFLGVIGGLGILGIGFWIYSYRRRKKILSPEERLIRQLLYRLEKIGYKRQPGETLYHFLNRIKGAEEVNRLYHLIRYRGEDRIEELQRAIARFLKSDLNPSQ